MFGISPDSGFGQFVSQIGGKLKKDVHQKMLMSFLAGIVISSLLKIRL